MAKIWCVLKSTLHEDFETHQSFTIRVKPKIVMVTLTLVIFLFRKWGNFFGTPFTKHDLRTHKLKNKVIRFVRNLVSWRVTCRHILKRNLMLVSNVRRVSLNLVTWRDMPGYTVVRSHIIVRNVRRDSINLAAWRHMPRYTVGSNLDCQQSGHLKKHSQLNYN